MARIIQPDTVGSILDDMDRRLRNLEMATGRYTGLEVDDASGVQRVLIGLLGDGSYGMQVNDANGNDIMDTTGLRQVAGVLGSASTGGTTNVTTTSDTDISGSSVSFSIVNRASNILVIAECTANPSVNSGGIANGQLWLHLSGTGTQDSAFQQAGLVTANTSATGQMLTPVALVWYISALAVGSYTVILRGKLVQNAAGSNMNVAFAATTVIQLGG